MAYHTGVSVPRLSREACQCLHVAKAAHSAGTSKYVNIDSTISDARVGAGGMAADNCERLVRYRRRSPSPHLHTVATRGVPRELLPAPSGVRPAQCTVAIVGLGIREPF